MLYRPKAFTVTLRGKKVGVVLLLFRIEGCEKTFVAPVNHYQAALPNPLLSVLKTGTLRVTLYEDDPTPVRRIRCGIDLSPFAPGWMRWPPSLLGRRRSSWRLCGRWKRRVALGPAPAGHLAPAGGRRAAHAGRAGRAGGAAAVPGGAHGLTLLACERVDGAMKVSVPPEQEGLMIG